MQNEKLYKTIIWILLGALAAVVLVAAFYHLRGMESQETTCQAGEIRRITVIYPDGDDGEAKTTYECIKEQ